MTYIYLAIGLTAGIISGTFGIGGGIIIVPLLVLVAKMAPHVATGTSLAVFVLPVGALGAWTYYKSGNINVAAALLVACGLFIGAYFGSKVAHSVSPLILKRSFAVLLVVVAAKMWIGK